MSDDVLSAAWLSAYAPTLWVMVGVAGLLLVQLLVADVVGILRKHTPGMPAEGGHANLLFRLNRAYANTNETLAAFALLAVAGVLLGATPAWLNSLALLYIAGRVAHMLCYYLRWSTARSAAFGVSLIALLGMLVVDIQALTIIT